MKRADYVKLQASILKKLCDQREKNKMPSYGINV